MARDKVLNFTLHVAWNNWSAYHGDRKHYGEFMRFIEQDSFPMNWDDFERAYMAHPQTAHRIELLCSPHYHAIIKAYYARKDVDQIA